MEMEFAPFTVIAGANASGKSNLFDALQLLGKLANAESIKKAFTEQRGDFIELFTQFGPGHYAKDISFCVEMLVNRTIKDAWGSEATLKYTRLRYELIISRITNENGIDSLYVTYEAVHKLSHNEDKWIRIIPKNNLSYWRPKVGTGKRGIPYMETVTENGIATVLVPQDGTTGNKRRFPLNHATRTVLSSFDTIDFPHVLAVKKEMMSWNFLQLNPEDLRRPTNKQMGEDKVSPSGKNLAGALNRIKQVDTYALREIGRKLQTFLPNFISVDIDDDLENKQYVIKLTDSDGKTYSSRVLSEGTLRVLALCILEYDDNHTGLLCFEEPENGVHPFRIGKMAELLRDLSSNFNNAENSLRQVIVNTHSPLLLKQIGKWSDQSFVQLWYAEIRKRVVTFDQKRTVLAVSNIMPIEHERLHQLDLFSEQDNKLSIHKAAQYLDTVNL